MKRKMTILLFVFFNFSVLLGQQIITKKYSSEILGAIRNFKIYIPEGYEENKKKNYPLTIILGSEFIFDLYVANSSLFAKKDKAPRQIIVGVSIEKTKKTDVSFNTNTGKLFGTSKNFYRFLRDEVLFYIESTYRTSPFLTLVGNGYGANLITHFLKEKTIFVNSYICINPSFSDFIGEQIQSYNLERYGNEDNTFYFYSNNSSSFSAKKQEKITGVQKGLSSFEIKNLNIINDYIETSNTISASSEAIPRAITKVFEIYSGISKEEYEKNIKDLSPPEAIAYLEEKYLEIEFLFGSNLGIRKRDIFAIENIIIDKEDSYYLKDFGVMILNLFPSSPLGDYYIGRFYENKEQYKEALNHYKIGYGKMDPADPNADKFYENILRIGGQ